MAKWPYSTQRWLRLRRCKLNADPICEYCKERDILTSATEVDHRKRINDGGDPWDWDNLVSTCHPCHQAKTWHVDRQSGAVPIIGCDVNGVPNDPAKRW